MSQANFMGAEDVVPSHTTDVIISGYENKISQNIASKTLSASKRGEAPDFTKEELLYLNRKAGEDEDTELKVITPAPLVTLKKGRTELNIGHAVKLVQKMEEKYPTGTGISPSKDNTLPPYYEEQVDYAVQQLQKEEPLRIEQPIKTVNKNAYEIRSDVLKMSIDFLRWQTELDDSVLKPTTDSVLEVAQRFYKFVENRR